MALKTYGPMAVDWENRIDFDRLRRERLARAKVLLAKSEMGALLCFDMNNVRYLTATHIGTWAQDKISRFSLLPQNDESILWDFGSAARYHQQNCRWLGDRSRPGIPLLRGAMSPEVGRAEHVARKIKVELEKRGLHQEPLGIDVVEPPILFALQREGIKIVDGQQLMSDARVLKTQDEISLLNHSAMMGDAAGKRGRGCLDAAISQVQEGRAAAEMASLWRKAEEFGVPDEEAAYALQFGDGIGLAIWEKPLISRMVSLEHAHEIKPGMVFALETFWPSTDGWSAARIEEEIVVTETGHEVITRFPADQLMVAGAHYYPVNGPLSTTRENEAPPSRRVKEMVAASANVEGVAATD